MIPYLKLLINVILNVKIVHQKVLKIIYALHVIIIMVIIKNLMIV